MIFPSQQECRIPEIQNELKQYMQYLNIMKHSHITFKFSVTKKNDQENRSAKDE